jgi:hypothetical protein
MVASLEANERAFNNPVDEAVLVGKPAGPDARELASQRLRFPDTLKRVAAGLLDEPHQAVGYPRILLLPVVKILPELGLNEQVPLGSSHSGT